MHHAGICAVDVGSSYIKAAVYAADQRVLAASTAEFPANCADDRAEADPEAVWEAFTAAVRDAVAGCPVSPTGLAIACQMAGLVLLDAGREPIGPLILGIDRRGGSMSRSAESAVHATAKLRWFAEYRPADIAAAGFVGGIKEYLLARLTGRWVTDPSSASVSGLYDVYGRAWSPKAIARAGFGPDAVPDVVRPTSVIGDLLPAAASACSLPAQTEVVAGIGDGPAGSLAAGATGPGQVCLSLGTTIVVRLFTRSDPAPDLPKTRVPLFVQHVADDWFCVGARFDKVGRSGDRLGSVDAPDLRIHLSEMPDSLAPLLGWFAATELRPIGSGLDEPVLRALAAQWSLPVVQTAATDGTLGAAGLLTTNDTSWPDTAPAADVVATFAPEGGQVIVT